MGLLILGLALFLGIHLLPIVVPLRNALFGALGEKAYKGLFSLVSFAGLGLIAIGYGRAPSQPQLFAPSPAAIQVAPLAMLVSFVLLASANMRTRLRQLVRHPMLLGVIIWSLVHLLANGSARATWLFGAFLVWALVALVSAIGRHAVKSFQPSARQGLIALAAGVVLALLVMLLHRPLFGVAVVPWGL